MFMSTGLLHMMERMRSCFNRGPGRAGEPGAMWLSIAMPGKWASTVLVHCSVNINVFMLRRGLWMWRVRAFRAGEQERTALLSLSQIPSNFFCFGLVPDWQAKRQMHNMHATPQSRTWAFGCPLFLMGPGKLLEGRRFTSALPFACCQKCTAWFVRSNRKHWTRVLWCSRRLGLCLVEFRKVLTFHFFKHRVAGR